MALAKLRIIKLAFSKIELWKIFRYLSKKGNKTNFKAKSSSDLDLPESEIETVIQSYGNSEDKTDSASELSEECEAESSKSSEKTETCDAECVIYGKTENYRDDTESIQTESQDNDNSSLDLSYEQENMEFITVLHN